MKFLAIPGTVLEQLSLSSTAKLIYGLLRYRQHDNSCCWPSEANLAASLGGASRSLISRSIGQLETAKLISVKRQIKRANIYTVKMFRDDTFLRVSLDLVAMPGISALDKLLISSLEYKSQNDDGHAYPYQRRLARELGISRATIQRALDRLESDGKIQVAHRGGGRRRGNYYQVTSEVWRPILIHDSKKKASKQGAKDKYFNEFKENNQKFSLKTVLSSKKDAYFALLRQGIGRSVAQSIVFDQNHPPESVWNAIENALVLEPVRHSQGKGFKISAYIVGTLNRARNEVHTVRLSPLAARDRDRRNAIKKAISDSRNYKPSERITNASVRRKYIEDQKRLLGVA